MATNGPKPSQKELTSLAREVIEQENALSRALFSGNTPSILFAKSKALQAEVQKRKSNLGKTSTLLNNPENTILEEEEEGSVIPVFFGSPKKMAGKEKDTKNSDINPWSKDIKKGPKF